VTGAQSRRAIDERVEVDVGAVGLAGVPAHRGVEPEELRPRLGQGAALLARDAGSQGSTLGRVRGRVLDRHGAVPRQVSSMFGVPLVVAQPGAARLAAGDLPRQRCVGPVDRARALAGDDDLLQVELVERGQVIGELVPSVGSLRAALVLLGGVDLLEGVGEGVVLPSLLEQALLAQRRGPTTCVTLGRHLRRQLLRVGGAHVVQ
jgi:hypothetical protein